MGSLFFRTCKRRLASKTTGTLSHEGENSLFFSHLFHTPLTLPQQAFTHLDELLTSTKDLLAFRLVELSNFSRINAYYCMKSISAYPVYQENSRKSGGSLAEK